MTPADFVSGLALAMKVERTELATVDRALAKGGLRQIARGRSRPDINLVEGIQIVCAWAGVEKLTDAAEEVTRLEQYCPDAVPDDEYELTKKRKPLFGSDFGEEEKDLYGRNFFAVLCEVARWLGEERLEAKRVNFSIERGGPPEISYDWELEKRKLGFAWYGKLKLFQEKKTARAPVVITASIRGPVLKWIYDVTEGA